MPRVLATAGGTAAETSKPNAGGSAGATTSRSTTCPTCRTARSKGCSSRAARHSRTELCSMRCGVEAGCASASAGAVCEQRYVDGQCHRTLRSGRRTAVTDWTRAPNSCTAARVIRRHCLWRARAKTRSMHGGRCPAQGPWPVGVARLALREDSCAFCRRTRVGVARRSAARPASRAT